MSSPAYRIRSLEAELEETYRSVAQLTNELAEANERLEHLSLYDALTGLPNRSLFLDRLEQAIALRERSGGSFAVLMMDLNRFKDINDSLGHNVGDELLQQVADRLRTVVRNSDTVARLGGDEFVALLPTSTTAEGSAAVCEKIISNLERPVVLGGETVDVGVSIGIARYPYHGSDGSKLLGNADMAMYDAKRCGRGYAMFNADQEATARRAALLPGHVSRAIEEDELVLCYQPKVDLRSLRVVGVEALTRWRHPEFGHLMPSQFITAIERSAAIKPFSLEVIRRSLEQTLASRQAGLDLTLSINLSGRALHDWELPRQVFDLIEHSGLPPDGLMLEITEDALMIDPERALAVVDRLHEDGVRISIDDFGTGFSALNWLTRMPVSEVKIDTSLVENVTTNLEHRKVIMAICELCQSLGFDVVGEGAESLEALKILKKLGCSLAQGYSIARPMAWDELLAWLDNWPEQIDCAGKPEPAA
ncbi:MAG: EAL domain-containing protein [Alphaproteobacteria bacterium]|nr:EAL domain-containing protein [Alphaproteobacteria bacterium]